MPTILFVFASIWSSPNILAKPKSEICGFIAALSSTLLVFRFLVSNLDEDIRLLEQYQK